MQLIQIGQTPAKTIQQFIEEMSARQSAEVEQLKQAALQRYTAARHHRTSKARTQRVRCKQPSAQRTSHAITL
ncbi:MAG TPA: hypothetical protein VII29_06645 [Terriglobales bacterium]